MSAAPPAQPARVSPSTSSSSSAVPFGTMLGPAPSVTDGTTSAATTTTTGGAGNGTQGVAYRYHYVQYLGRGGYGLTWVVRRAADGAVLVVKILALQPVVVGRAASPTTAAPGKPSKTRIEPSSLDRVRIEMTNLARVSDDVFCTRLLDHAIVDNHALLFMEYCDAGDLASTLSSAKRRSAPFKEDVLRIILLQTLFALNHLHRVGMIHRDVKAGNVLLCRNGLIKLGDFGLSATVEVAKTFCGTLSHLAPEVWNKQHYGQRADVWSLGVLMYHLMFLQLPFPSRTTDDVLRQQICSGDYIRMSDRNELYEPAFVTLCERMLTLDPAARPSVLDLLRDPLTLTWINDFPRLLAGSPNVPEFARTEVLQCLVRDEVLVQDPATGAYTASPVLAHGLPPRPSPTTIDQLDASASSEIFRIDTTIAAAAAEREAAREEARASLEGTAMRGDVAAQGASSESTNQHQQRHHHAATAAEDDEASNASADEALSGLLEGASGSARAIHLPPPFKKPGQADHQAPSPEQQHQQQHAPSKHANQSPPQAAGRGGGEKRGIVFKRSKAKHGAEHTWTPRALILQDGALYLHVVNTGVVSTLVHECIDEVRDGTHILRSKPNVLPLAQVISVDSLPPVVAAHAEMGVESGSSKGTRSGGGGTYDDDDDEADAAETLHPFRLTTVPPAPAAAATHLEAGPPSASRHFDLGVTDRAARDEWLVCLREAIAQNRREQQRQR